MKQKYNYNMLYMKYRVEKNKFYSKKYNFYHRHFHHRLIWCVVEMTFAQKTCQNSLVMHVYVPMDIVSRQCDSVKSLKEV